MKWRYRILIGILALLTICGGYFVYAGRPISEEAANEEIQGYLKKVLDKNDSLSSILLTVYSEETGYMGQFAVGTMNLSSEQPVQKNSRFHSASVGKTMCAAVVGILADEGKLRFDDKISKWLDKDTLQGLFVVDGMDYSDQVTIEQLLRHTSGASCYFQDPVKNGKTMLELIKENPDRKYIPQDLIAFTRDRQRPVGKPGEQFHYSDTGYVLLGLILEAIEQKPYSKILAEKIFEPLNMNDSYLLFYQDEPNNMVGVYIDGVDYRDKNALSLDWAGGGIVTSMDDLLKFMRALESGELLSDEVYSQMTDFKEKYDRGIYYGMGMMYFDFSELSPLLGSMTDVYGAIGSTGVYAFYDREKRTYFIANFGLLGFEQKSVETLVEIKMICDRIK